MPVFAGMIRPLNLYLTIHCFAMKFVDEVVIQVIAGKGGDGCLSFRREKFAPWGGPNGGNGGIGASIYLEADNHINTLADFRHQRIFKAQNGQPGMGTDSTGRAGEDLTILVPVGTTIYDAKTNEKLGDLTEAGQRLRIAKGGHHGYGNAYFKTSTNRAPRRATAGFPGEEHELRLELNLLADVGLLGLPNAGKSTLISVVSNAKPKIADYPFTTLHPNLGVVRVGPLKSFVMADIPGLIEGASEGAGLGIQFLKHLNRTKLLLHLVDISGFDGTDPLQAIRTVETELKQYSEELASKPRWLVFNKLDLIDSEEADLRCQAILDALQWSEPSFKISCVQQAGTQYLCYRVMDHLEAVREHDVEQKTEDVEGDMKDESLE